MNVSSASTRNVKVALSRRAFALSTPCRIPPGNYRSNRKNSGRLRVEWEMTSTNLGVQHLYRSAPLVVTRVVIYTFTWAVEPYEIHIYFCAIADYELTCFCPNIQEERVVEAEQIIERKIRRILQIEVWGEQRGKWNSTRRGVWLG